MQPVITITFNPATNELGINSAVPPAESVLLLARAHQLALNHASQPPKAIAVPDADAQRILLARNNGAVAH